MTSLPGTPENIKASLIRVDIEPDPELDEEGDFVVDIPLRTGYFAYRAGSMVVSRRFDMCDESFEAVASIGRVDVTAARAFGRTARTASVFFDVPLNADITDIAVEGIERLLSGNIDPVRMGEIREPLDAREAWLSGGQIPGRTL